MSTLTNKESMVIQEEKANEELCIAKYEKGIAEAQDPALKQLFSSILAHEKQHLTSLNRILNGDIPDLQKEAQGKQNSNQQNQQSSGQNSPQGANQSATMQNNLQNASSQSSNQNSAMQNNAQGSAQSSSQATNSNSGSQNQMNSQFSMEASSELSPDKKFHGDYVLCQDALAAEKYVSSSYNQAVFDCLDTKIRQVLNHIQKEEQEHGEQISNYLISHGYTQPK